MVGTETSGNRNPKNNIRICATSEFLDYIRSLPNPKGLPAFQVVARDFLQVHKEGFVKMHGQECYDEHMKRFNRTTTEMKRDKLKQEKEKQKEREERDALRRRELNVKESEAKKQVKYEELLRRLEKYKAQLERSRNTQYESKWIEKVAQVESEIRALGYEIPA